MRNPARKRIEICCSRRAEASFPARLRRRAAAWFAMAGLIAGLSVTAVETASAQRLIGVDGFDGILYDIIPSTGGISNSVSLPDILCAKNFNVVSMAKHPGSGVIYAIENGNPSTLLTINPATGVVTTVVTLDLGWISTITFGAGPAYPLYGIVGDPIGGAPRGSIHTINTGTGVTTATTWVTGGEGSHAIEYNPTDDRIYHFFSAAGGGGTDPDGLEKINPADGTRTVVPLSGASYGAVNGIVYAGSGLFYAADTVNGNILSFTSAGVVTTLASFNGRIRAVEYAGPNLLFANSETIFEVDPATGAESNVKPYSPGEPCPPPLYSIARDSGTETYYVITDADFPNVDQANRIAEVDIDTGTLSNDVNLSENGIAGITVANPGGQIYGVIGGGGSLGSGTIVTINKTTGAVADTTWNSSGGNGGHSLEFNSNDGQLYHFYQGASGPSMEKINPTTGLVTSIGTITGADSSAFVGAVYDGSGNFYTVDASSSTIYMVTAAGVATQMGNAGGSPDFVFPRGLEIVPYSGLTVQFVDTEAVIPDGDTTPSGVITEGTDFGALDVTTGLITRVFQIWNDSGSPVTLTGPNPVMKTGPGNTHFSITQPAGSLVIPVGNSTIFTITYDPSAVGFHDATISIASDSPVENPYTFAITGEGANGSPEITVRFDFSNDEIADGDTTPSDDSAEGTDFGAADPPDPFDTITHPFRIINDGVTNLNLTSDVTITGPGAAHFTVALQPKNPLLAPGESTIFQIEFDPSASGVFTATVNLSSDDSDESPYDFLIKGTGTAAAAAPSDPNAALKAFLSKKIKKLKKKIKAAKKKKRRDKAKRLTKKLRKLIRKLRAL